MAETTERAVYTGPSVKGMIASHTLAENIINRHNDPCPVLGPTELVLLRRFVNDPDARNETLNDCNMIDGDDAEFVGQAAQVHGSLAGFIVARHGRESVMQNFEIEMLRKWFNSGVADERMKCAIETGKAA